MKFCVQCLWRWNIIFECLSHILCCLWLRNMARLVSICDELRSYCCIVVVVGFVCLSFEWIIQNFDNKLSVFGLVGVSLIKLCEMVVVRAVCVL